MLSLPASISVASARMPKTSEASSSLQMIQSTKGTILPMHSAASSRGAVPGRHFQSFLRKFRSQEITMPRSDAASTSASVDAKAFSLSDGVMPVM